MMKRPLLCAMLLAYASAAPAFGQAADADLTSSVEQLRHSIGAVSWLAGCWENVDGQRRAEEQWMAPAGGTMVGMSRTVAGNLTREFEFMLIREEGAGLIFTARPSGQAGATFSSVRVTASSVALENPAHDFPQRITYTLQDDGSLLARIEGQSEGTPRSVDFPLRRAACPPGL